MTDIKLNITKNSRDIPEDLADRLYDLSYNGIEISPKDELFPMPWDAGCYIEDGMFIIDGSVGGGTYHPGYAKVGLPLDQVNNYLDLSIYPEDDDAVESINEIMTEYGWL